MLKTIRTNRVGQHNNEGTASAVGLRVVFHPKQKFDYDGSAPSTHWLDDATPVLLIRRDKGWKQVDLASGVESDSEIVRKLADNIAKLEGIDQKQAISAANSAITSLKRVSEIAIIRLGKSLATVSITSPAKRLTQDASKWGMPRSTQPDAA